ncbi:unnamed protein product [Prunus armeniaca]
MATHAKASVRKPNPKYPHHALANKLNKWRLAMADEFNALIRARTWTLVPHTPAMNVLPNKWVFRFKWNLDGTIQHYKACFVTNGFHQQPSLDYGETFCPVANHSTIRFILALSMQFSWHVRQLDVQNIFLHGYLDEEVYMRQPVGFVDSTYPNHTKYVVDLLKSINMHKAKPMPTPAISGRRLSISNGDPLPDPTECRSTVGALQVLRSNVVFLAPVLRRNAASLSTLSPLSHGSVLFFIDLYLPTPCPKLWCDNISALSLAFNPVFHSRTRHVEVADIFTKGLSPARFSLLWSKLPMLHQPISLRGCNGRES